MLTVALTSAMSSSATTTRRCSMARPTDKTRAEASLHADDARRQLLEGIDKRQALDLPTEGNTSIRVEADNMKNLLANVDAN